MTENEDGMDYLRIPYEKIKFGKKLEVQGYGTVFEGEFDDQRVALKQLNITNLGNVKPKLLAEILTISRFRQHPNLVALLGFCDEKSNEIILVYEYVSSGNLADKMRKRLTTIQRLEICLGAARGLDYLHTGVDANTPGVTHGNIKLSKILLNSDPNSSKFEAKVSSFGLSKILPGQGQKILESMDTADEVTERVTKESDVYSFGVLLLEVLCGVPELVDTDDYQERHVTELVPKRLEQNKLRKIVHFDIRKEIKTESLDTYAKIACQCVLESPEERPSMSKVVEELEKALRLQGGEVSDVQIVGRVIDPPEGGNGVIVESELDFAGKVAGGEVSVVSASSESTSCAPEDHSMRERSIPTPISYTVDEESVPDKTHIEGAKKESSGDLEATEAILDNSNSNEKSKINVEGEEENQSKIVATSLESSTDDTNTTTNHSLNKEVQDSGFVESSSDKMEHLRIPYDKIRFGKKIDIRGYGSMFEGEFDHQRVALKRLNVTNLAHIKPKLLAEILTVSRFRQHPNLVALLGFCDEKTNEIVLVYEFVSNGNLADKRSKHLTAIQRLEICLGAARGLNYLHTGVDSTPAIVHGDIKLSKILLNSDSTPSKFEAKVSGFGLSKLIPGQGRKTLDPTDKESDVYSFGVVLLEVLCGVRELVDTDDYQERDVTELVPKRLEQNRLRVIVHFDIREEITTESLETYARIACLCVMKDPKQRPTMAQVVEELEKALKLQQDRSFHASILGDVDDESVPDITHIEDVEKDSNNNPETTEEIIDGSDSSEKLNINGETEYDNQGKITAAFLKSSNGDTSTTNHSLKQGGEVSDVNILGSSNGNGLPEQTINEEGDDDGETMGSNKAEKSSVAKETNDDPMLSNGLDLSREITVDEDTSVDTPSEDRNEEKNAAEDITTQGNKDGESGDKSTTNDPESTEEIIDDSKSIEESKIIPENEVDNGTKITTVSSESNNGDGTKEDDAETKENVDDKYRATEISMGGQGSIILDSDMNTEKENANSALLDLHDTEEKPEPIINIRERDFSDFATNDNFKSVKESESKPSDSISTCSESSNGDGTTPSDYLLQKSPANGITMKKPSANGSRNCCSCAWWRFFWDRVVSYGGQFWNKLRSCFTWMKGLFFNKRD